jgi:outer membrane protein assembly factor BamB
MPHPLVYSPQMATSGSRLVLNHDGSSCDAAWHWEGHAACTALLCLLVACICLCIIGSSCHNQKRNASNNSYADIIYRPPHPLQATSSGVKTLKPEELLTNNYSNNRNRIVHEIKTQNPSVKQVIDLDPMADWNSDYIRVLPDGRLVYGLRNNAVQIDTKVIDLPADLDPKYEPDTWFMSIDINPRGGFIAYNKNHICYLDNNGNTLWHMKPTQPPDQSSSRYRNLSIPFYSPSAIYYVIGNSTRIIRLDSSGDEVNHCDLLAGYRGCGHFGPAIDAQERMYICDAQGRLYAFGETGRLIWCSPPIIQAFWAQECEAVDSGPCVRFDHSILIGTVIGVFVYGFDGNVQWRYEPNVKSQLYRIANMGILKDNAAILHLSYYLEEIKGWRNEIGKLSADGKEYVPWALSTPTDPDLVITSDDKVVLCYINEKDDQCYLALYSSVGEEYWKVGLGNPTCRIIGIDDTGKIYIFHYDESIARKQIEIVY